MNNTNSFLHFNTRNLIYLILFGIMMSMFNACNLPDVIPDGPDPTLDVTVDGDKMVDFGTEVTVNGFASHSTGESTSVSWELMSQPSSSNLSLSGTDQNSITFLPDALGEYVLRFTAMSSDDLTAFDEVVITVIKAPVHLFGTISSDRVLENVYDDPNDPDYIVSGTLQLRAQLTIDPDVLIIFEENAAMSVQTDGSLIAVGSESSPIVMTGVQQTPGFWRGLNFESRNPDNELKYVTVEYGGSGGFDGADRKANVTLNDAIVKISNCEITNSEGVGLLARNEEDELPDFSENILTSNAVPAEINKNQYHFLDASSDFTGNVDDYIDTWGQNPLTEKVTWNALNVPYRFSGAFERIDSDLTIEEGAEFIGQPGGGLLIRTDGSLVAKGTSAAPIVFRGEEDVRGYWVGISIESNTNRNELAYVTVKNGGERGFDGANLKANIILDGAARLKMSNCNLSSSGDFGLIVRNVESTITLFENNTITDNKIPIQCTINHFHYFDSASDLTGNDEDVIITSVFSTPTDVDATWRKTTAPYKLLRISDVASTITIEPGVEIIGMDNAAIEVKKEGTIIAIGTESEPIIMRGQEDVQGFWRGIRVLSNNAQNEMTNVQVSNGGSSGFDGAGRIANVEVGPAAMLKLTNALISDSNGYGVRVQKDGSLTESNNTFVNNKDGDIFYEE
jgi:hypothetical protein